MLCLIVGYLLRYAAAVQFGIVFVAVPRHPDDYLKQGFALFGAQRFFFGGRPCQRSVGRTTQRHTFFQRHNCDRIASRRSSRLRNPDQFDGANATAVPNGQQEVRKWLDNKPQLKGRYSQGIVHGRLRAAKE